MKIFKQDNEIFNSNFNLIEKMDFLYLKENIIYCLDYYLLNVVEDYPLGNQLSSDMLSLKGVLAEMKNYDNLIYIGDAFFFKEDYQNAILCYDEVLKINPNDEKAWYSKGNALFNTEKYDKAIECYDDVLKINPNDEKAWINKGNALNNKRKYEKAIECYDKALKISPNVAIALYNKGCVLFNIRKCDEALEFLDKALKINPNIEKENGKYKVTIVDKAGREDHNE